MNDDIREKLSAYLDGALSDSERQAVELELARSAEMRTELEALRLVSSAVRGLPKAKLPAGFRARLEARRMRGFNTERRYFLLPPASRPFAATLAAAAVALVLWNTTQVPSKIKETLIGWDGVKFAVQTAVEAPASIDVSGRLSAGGGDSPSKGVSKNAVATDLPSSPSSQRASVDKAVMSLDAIGTRKQPLEISENQIPAASSVHIADLDLLKSGAVKQESFSARSEEERSAINERLYKGLEKEKKRMGIISVIDKGAQSNRVSDRRGSMVLRAPLQLPRSFSGGSARGREEAAVVRALPLKSPDALSAAWAAAGLPGEPPVVGFPEKMALFLAGPTGCGIVSVQDRGKFIVVSYKETGFDAASARVQAVPLSAKPIVVKRAE